MRTRPRCLTAPVALVLLAGCAEPNLQALTVPPPGKTAELVDSSDERAITLSKGMALGFECKYKGSPCKGASATVDDPTVARAFASYADKLSSYFCDPAGGGQCSTPGVVFVVLGTTTGTTTLTVATDDGDVDLDLEVVP